MEEGVGAAKPKRAAKAVAAEGSVQLCGHMTKAGATCKRQAPCSSHNKKAHAEAKKRAAEAAIGPADVELGAGEGKSAAVDLDAGEDDGMATFLAAQSP